MGFQTTANNTNVVKISYHQMTLMLYDSSLTFFSSESFNQPHHNHNQQHHHQHWHCPIDVNIEVGSHKVGVRRSVIVRRMPTDPPLSTHYSSLILTIIINIIIIVIIITDPLVH